MAMPPAETAHETAVEPGGFRLRDATLIIAANVLGQVVGLGLYVAVLAIQAGTFDDGIMWRLQTDPHRNHLIVVSGGCGYLLMLPWILHLWRTGRISFRRTGFVWPKPGWFGIALGLFVVLKLLTVWAMSHLDKEVVEAGYRTMEGIAGAGPLWAAMSALLVVVAAPFTEELAFRAALYQGLRRHMPGIAAAGLAVACFAAIHVQYAFAGGLVAVVTTAQVALLGAMLMFLYLKSGSLWPGIALHAVNNALTLAVLFAALPG